jgi:hypothetical protein
VDDGTAVHGNGLACDQVAVVRGKGDERPEQIRRNRGPLQHPRADVGLLALLGDVLLVLAAEREARRDRVRADAKLPELASQRTREPYRAAFGGGVVDVVSDALEECARGDVDDVALPCTFIAGNTARRGRGREG